MAIVRDEPGAFRETVIGDWQVSVAEEVLQAIGLARSAARPSETGGILVGHWDRSRQAGFELDCAEAVVQPA